MTQYRFWGGKGPVFKLSRSKKAKKIRSIIEDFNGSELKNLKILDIGCGNGDIISVYLSKNQVYGVDIEDLRRDKNSKIIFSIVDSAILPFEDTFFDVVISNHAIEHISEQKVHLKEIRRVLKNDGFAYLATPNKTSPFMEGHAGNDIVLRYKNMSPLFKDQGFESLIRSIDVLKQPDKYNTGFSLGKYIPRLCLKILLPILPSHIFILTKANEQRYKL